MIADFYSWKLLVMCFTIAGFQWLTIHPKDLEYLWTMQSRWIVKKYSNVEYLEVYPDILFNAIVLLDRVVLNERNVVIRQYQVTMIS